MFRVILFILLLLTGLSAGETTEIKDPIHGIKVSLPAGWSVKVFPSYVLIISDDMTRFITFRVYPGRDLKKLARALLQETRFMGGGTTHFKRIRNGLLVRSDLRGYPYVLDPMLPITWGLQGRIPPQNYTSLTYIIPLRRSSLLVTFLYPHGTSRAQIKEMISIARTFRFLRRRIPSKRVFISDPETGGVAATLRIPKGWDFYGTVMPQALREIHFVASGRGEFVRRDFISLTGAAGPFGGSTMISINGQAYPSQMPVIIDSVGTAAEFLVSLWNLEGGSWSVVDARELPKPGSLKALEESFMRQMTALGAVYQHQVNVSILHGAFEASDGRLKRIALITALSTDSFSPGTGVRNFQTNLLLITAQARTSEKAKGLLSAVLFGFRPDPNWFLSKVQRNFRDQAYWNRVILGVLDEHNQFLTRTSIAWANLLSEKTFVKDPRTGEIFQVDLSQGRYWRDPSGEMILGGVREMSGLEEVLRARGWRKLKESLEGFPEQWR